LQIKAFQHYGIPPEADPPRDSDLDHQGSRDLHNLGPKRQHFLEVGKAMIRKPLPSAQEEFR
jgi:hypothetical protein